MKITKCRACEGPIVWAWFRSQARWVTVDPETVDGFEEPFENGFLFDRAIHQFHSCPKRDKARKNREQACPHRTILHVTASAPPEVIRAAYKALALIHHPDVGGDAEQMTRINVAYSALIGGR